jgi:hypothetical protein
MLCRNSRRTFPLAAPAISANRQDNRWGTLVWAAGFLTHTHTLFANIQDVHGYKGKLTGFVLVKVEVMFQL